MSFEEFNPIPLDEFGGLVTWPLGADVPWGRATDLLNVRFKPGSVETRPGITSPSGATYSVAGPTRFNGLAQFIDNVGTKTLLGLDTNGDIRKHNGADWSTVLLARAAIGGSTEIKQSMWRSTPLFNRIFTAAFRADTGFIEPGGPIRDYDGTNLDILSPEGPGSGPAAVNSATAGSIGAGIHKVAVLFEIRGGRYLTEPSQLYGPLIPIDAAPTGAVRAANVVTITTTVVHGLVVGQTVVVEGVTDATFNGTFVVATVPTTTTFTYAQVAGNATSGSGTIKAAAQFNSAGSFKVDLSLIPTGPSWVSARRVIITAAGGLDYFYLTSFRIADNTTTTVTLDFDETGLQQGENYNKYFRNLRIPDFSGVTSYGNRLVCWGGLNTIKMINLGFDGGFDANGVPLGWTPMGGSAGGSRGTTTAFAGDYYRIRGDGATASPRGEIGNTEAATKLLANTAYRVAVRVRKESAWAGTTPQVVLDLIGTGVNTTGLEISTAAVTTDWLEFEGELTSGLASIPTDLKFRVFVQSGTLGNGNGFDIDRIRIWPSLIKFENSTLRISDPFETRFDGINGLAQISKDDGQQVVACMEQNGYLYVQKERSAHVIKDDGQNAPSQWAQQRVSTSVGGGSPNAVDGTESYFIVASRAGAYRVDGLSLSELSEEIRTTWNRINWGTSQTIHVTIDTENARVYFFVPLDSDTVPNHCLYLDFREGWGTGRKWGLDKYPTPAKIRCSTRVETATRRQDIFLGSTDEAAGATAQVWRFADGAGSVAGDGAGTLAIQSYYETAFKKAREAIGGQDLFGGVAAYIAGAGTLLTTLKGFDGLNEALPNKTLATQMKEIPNFANLENDRAKMRFETNAASAWFQLSKAVLYSMEWATITPQ